MSVHDASAATLIAQSVLEDRCVRAQYTDELHEDLLVECEDMNREHGPHSDTLHYWGSTDSGGEWSVRLRGAP